MGHIKRDFCLSNIVLRCLLFSSASGSLPVLNKKNYWLPRIYCIIYYYFLRHLLFSTTVPDPLVYVLVSEKMKPVEVELEEIHYFLAVPNQLKKLEAYH